MCGVCVCMCVTKSVLCVSMEIYVCVVLVVSGGFQGSYLARDVSQAWAY